MAILLFVHLTRHSSTASEQLSLISLVPEIGTPGLMSGDGKRSLPTARWPAKYISGLPEADMMPNAHNTAVQRLTRLLSASLSTVPASLGTEDSQWAGHEAG
jgi:hypothetical protein